MFLFMYINPCGMSHVTIINSDEPFQALRRPFYIIATAFGGLATPPETYTRQKLGLSHKFGAGSNSHSTAHSKEKCPSFLLHTMTSKLLQIKHLTQR
jgi:hypothetical protein